MIEGALKINERLLNKTAVLCVHDTGSVKIEAEARSGLLIRDIPMI